MEKISLFEFYTQVNVAYAKNKAWRYGQSAFNVLADVRPDLSELIRGTRTDPFHMSETDEQLWKEFTQFIEMNWYTFQTSVWYLYWSKNGLKTIGPGATAEEALTSRGYKVEDMQHIVHTSLNKDTFIWNTKTKVWEENQK